MNEWIKAREDYLAVEIPQELVWRVGAAVAEAEEKRSARTKHRKTAFKVFKAVGAVAACFVILFAGLNLSPVLAQAAADLPVVGGFFKVLTVRSWHQSGPDISYEIDVPGITGGGDYTQRVNAEIQKRVDEKIAEGNKIVQDFKTAFFATGGTQEQWDKRNNKVSVTYAVKYQQGDTLSFVIDSFVSTASAYQEQFFYNLDLKNDRELTLKDLLGDGWTDICDRSIQTQIDNYPLSAGEKSPFFTPEAGGFKSVDETTRFYINAAGTPVVVYPRAAVAIGAMGVVEFEIKR